LFFIALSICNFLGYVKFGRQWRAGNSGLASVRGDK
jgi:hypothetical protein